MATLCCRVSWHYTWNYFTNFSIDKICKWARCNNGFILRARTRKHRALYLFFCSLIFARCCIYSRLKCQKQNENLVSLCLGMAGCRSGTFRVTSSAWRSVTWDPTLYHWTMMTRIPTHASGKELYLKEAGSGEWMQEAAVTIYVRFCLRRSS